MSATDSVISELFWITPEIRYIAVARGQEVELHQRPGIEAASGSESDRYEELLVNPTLITLARQRGEIDCGGLRFLLVGYGNFHQLVIPGPEGHVSIAFELGADPLRWLRCVTKTLADHGPGRLGCDSSNKEEAN
jgi:hypothetical protein